MTIAKMRLIEWYTCIKFYCLIAFYLGLGHVGINLSGDFQTNSAGSFQSGIFTSILCATAYLIKRIVWRLQLNLNFTLGLWKTLHWCSLLHHLAEPQEPPASAGSFSTCIWGSALPSRPVARQTAWRIPYRPLTSVLSDHSMVSATDGDL